MNCLGHNNAYLQYCIFVMHICEYTLLQIHTVVIICIFGEYILSSKYYFPNVYY